MKIAKKLCANDEIRVIAPSRSFIPLLFTKSQLGIAAKRIKGYDLCLSYGKFVNTINFLDSADISLRIQDFEEAVKDIKVKCIIFALGGYSAGDLLNKIDYTLLEKNQKILLGHSDNTLILNAVYAKTKLVTYYGLNYYQLGMEPTKIMEYTDQYFRKMLADHKEFFLEHPKQFFDSKYSSLQSTKEFFDHEGYWSINEGESSGTLIGGHLSSFICLLGTEYMPTLKGSIIMIEEILSFEYFVKFFQTLICLPEFNKVRGILIGKFLVSCKVTKFKLVDFINVKQELKRIPIIANVDFGHTFPSIILPIGGHVTMHSSNKEIIIKIVG